MIKIKIVGTDKVIRSFQRKEAMVWSNLRGAVTSGTRLVQNTMIKEHLRGPRPQKLDVVTSTLYSSIKGWTEILPRVILGKIGTNIWYGKMWETGEKVAPRGKQASLTSGVAKRMRKIYKATGKGPRKRPFLKPALEQKSDIIMNRIREAISKGVR